MARPRPVDECPPPIGLTAGAAHPNLPAIQASTLDILEKGGFDPAQARALAAAMDNEVKAARLVSVPILDARVAQLQRDIAETKAEIVRWVLLTGLAPASIIVGALYFFLNQTR